MIELRHFQNFIAVVEAGGVRQAARIVNLSPSAISRSVQQLEEHFGVSVIKRDSGQMVVTAQGETLLKEARILLAGVESLRPKLAQIEVVDSGSLRVGVNPTIANSFLPRLGVRLLRDYPNVEISTTIRDASELVDLMRAGELDIIFGHERLFSVQRDLEVTHLYDLAIPWWARKEHPLFSKTRVTLRDFADFPVISQHLPALYREQFLDLRLAADRARKGGATIHAHQCDDYQVLCRMAVESDAILLAPVYDITAGLFADRLRRLPMTRQMPDAAVAAAVPLAPSPSPLAMRFLDLMREEIDATLAAVGV
ncbi:MAG: LysR family transcriptional regulator [Verrucomicrobiales bacterium]